MKSIIKGSFIHDLVSFFPWKRIDQSRNTRINTVKNKTSNLTYPLRTTHEFQNIITFQN